MQPTIQASPQSAKERDFSAVNPATYSPIALTIRVEITSIDALTAPIAALIEALKSAAVTPVKIGPSMVQKSGGNGSTPCRERFGQTVENAEKSDTTGSTVNTETAKDDHPGQFGQTVENPENFADRPTVTAVETAANTSEGQSGQTVDFPENSADTPDTSSAPVNSEKPAENSPAEHKAEAAPSDAAPVEARQVSATDAAPVEARQVSVEPEKQSSITIMEVTRLITDIRNEFSELFTPERAKQFTEEIHKRSGISYPPKTPEECVRMHTALVAMRRVLRFNRNKRNG